MVVTITATILILAAVTIAYLNYDAYTGWSGPFVCNSSRTAVQNWSGTNTLIIYAGRWKFLRILIPYTYRELRSNGGVLDRVMFMMINYDAETLTHLTELVRVANKALKEEVFVMNFLGYPPGTGPPSKMRYIIPYYQIFSEITKNSSNRFFKMDDDIVYIHPGTFRKMIESKNSECCLLHFGNIVSNWRCNCQHQEMGVYDSEIVNPKRLKFGFAPNAYCGWKSSECAELSLRTFLHHYHGRTLDQYLFNGLELLVKRKRFSINFYMLDRDVIDIKAMQEVGPIVSDDEKWWTVMYSSKFRRPNCIVGGALVVHFSYGMTYQRMLQAGFLVEFESIVQKEVGVLMNKELWEALRYSAPSDTKDSMNRVNEETKVNHL